jgi:glycosyltransferase involved in cell wall biosynthesis
MSLTVVHVLARDALAGTELMVAALAEHGDRSAVRHVVVFLDRPGPVAARLRADGVIAHSVGGPRALWRLAGVLRRTRADVICGYGLRAGLAVRLLGRARARRSRTVTGVRGLYVTEVEDLRSPRGRLAMAAERLTTPLVDAYVANSRGALAVLAEHGVAPDRLHYVPNGIDVDRFPQVDRAGRPGPPLVVCVGRFTPVKRQRDLVDAAALLRARGVEARLAFAGAGPLQDAVRGQVAGLALGDRVVFHGALAPAAVKDLLAEADVACMPSSQEGMPGAVLEAMASGLPVVGTDVNGIADGVADGETGVLVAPGDPAALAAALERLLADPALRHTLGAAGRRRVADELSLDRMVAATLAVFRGLVA